MQIWDKFWDLEQVPKLSLHKKCLLNCVPARAWWGPSGGEVCCRDEVAAAVQAGRGAVPREVTVARTGRAQAEVESKGEIHQECNSIDIWNFWWKSGWKTVRHVPNLHT